MRIPIKYIASSGHEYNLISDGIKHKEANYWDWKYTAEGTKLQYGFRIADFSKDAKTYKTTLLFYGSEVQRRQLLGALHDDFENDIRQKKPGKLMWGSYYLMCYVMFWSRPLNRPKRSRRPLTKSPFIPRIRSGFKISTSNFRSRRR